MTRDNRISADRAAQIVDLYRQGVPVRQIAATMHCGRNAVSRIANGAGLRRSPRVPQISDAQAAIIRDMRQAGALRRDIAAAAGCSISCVDHCIRRMHLPRRQGQSKSSPSSDQWAQVDALLAQGLSPPAVARRMGIWEKHIYTRYMAQRRRASQGAD